MELKITKDDKHSNFYTVEQNGKICDGLTWDEMIGQVAYITCPKGSGCTESAALFRMHDPKDTEQSQTLLQSA